MQYRSAAETIAIHRKDAMTVQSFARWAEARTGDLANLETTDRQTLVDAINEVHTLVTDLTEVVDGLLGPL